MIKYDIHSIQNVTGSGEERKFVHVFENEPKSEDQICRLIEERTTLEREFHLRKSAAQKWLAQFVAEGKLRKEGIRTAPVYFLNGE